MRTRPLTFVASLALTLALTPALAAKTIKVSPNGSVTSIAAAVGLAGPGDKIEIAKGTYFGSFVVPAGRDGLMIEGEKGVVIDAWPLGGDDPAEAFGVTIQAADVTIKDVTIRNCGDQGTTPGTQGLSVMATGVTIEDVALLNAEDGIQIAAHVGRIEDCLVVGGGILVQGDDVEIIDTTVRSAPTGIAVFAHRVKVKGCTIANIRDTTGVYPGTGLFVQGAQPKIVGNEIVNVDERGIHVESVGGVVKKNVVRNAGGDGMSLVYGVERVEQNVVEGANGIGIRVWTDGDAAICRGNTVRDVTGQGMAVSMFGGGLVSENVVERVRSDDSTTAGGIVVNGDLGKIDDNILRDVMGPGIEVTSNSLQLTVRDNVIERCGLRGGAAFSIDGDDHLIDSNVVRRSAGDGVTITASNTTLIGNKSVANPIDGFDVDADSLTAIGNIAKKNGGEGLEHSGGSACHYEGNTLLQNRIDLAFELGGASFQQNVYETGGPSTSPDVD